MSEETCWTLIRDAAGGDDDARAAFARAYLPVVRAYLGARWARGPFRDEVDDAVQDAFVECLRGDGALAKADPEKPGRFRTFLYAVVRNIALRHEERAARERARRDACGVAPKDLSADDPRLSQVFDRAWADALLKRAAAGQRAVARERGEDALRRVELLRLRFAEGLPIREIAARWGEDPAVVHRQYARAREEYKEALRTEIAFHHAGTPGEIERECRGLLDLLE